MNDNEENNNFNTTQLSNRIQQIQEAELESSQDFFQGLNQRVQELQSANKIEEQLDIGADNGAVVRVSLPVVSFDALLPNQKLEGSTEDPTFIQLLMELGLGGWFVMTSLEFRSRKIRRNGILCKIEFLDAAKKVNGNKENDPHLIPTSLDFVILGKKRCRVFGKSEALKTRIGRWRRSYDENGEEMLLGWGEERFTDLAENAFNAANELDPASSSSSGLGAPPIADYTQWSKTEVESNLDQNENITPEIIQKAESLIPLVDEWYDLASNSQTYQNTNVTATARVQRNQPMLSIEPDKLLLRVLKDLGERPPPEKPTAFAFWAAALINPLPALGVSLEIRGKMLEAVDVEERLKILEFGLVRSIQNLKGERPL